MKKILLISLIIFLGFSTKAYAADDIYISQTAQGADTGANCANAHSAAWFNTGSNWGAGVGKITAGDTVHLCGSITTPLITQAGGTAGNPITLYFESGAKLSSPSSTMLGIYFNYFVIDGGTNGIIENTDNGTAGFYTTQSCLSGVFVNTAVHDLEVKNLTIQNQYVHVAGNDGPGLGQCGGIYGNGLGVNIKIHNNTIHDVAWCVNVTAQIDGAEGLEVYNNYFYNYDHGVTPIAGYGKKNNPALIHDNHFGSTQSWDSPGNIYHHDGMHVFFTSARYTYYDLYNNLFDGDWGVNNTSTVFNEGNALSIPSDTVRMRAWNNVFATTPTKLNNGYMNIMGSTTIIINNTVLGPAVLDSNGVSMWNDLIFKNNVVSGVRSFAFTGPGVGGYTGGTNDYNIYAAQAPGSNATFVENGVSYPTLALWQAYTNGEAHSQLISSAGLNADGTPMPGSAVVNAGVDLSSLGIALTDKNGVPRGTTWSIGAYQGGRTSTSMVSGGRAATSTSVGGRSATIIP